MPITSSELGRAYAKRHKRGAGECMECGTAWESAYVEKKLCRRCRERLQKQRWRAKKREAVG